MKLNWTVRFKNKLFWCLGIPAVLLVVQAVLKVFGVEVDLGELGNDLLNVVEAVFGVLGLLGIVVDPTTQGVNDSQQALTYSVPRAEG